MVENIQILRIRLGVYRLYSVAGNEGLNVTAQDLRDISAWALRNMNVLEAEIRPLEPEDEEEEDEEEETLGDGSGLHQCPYCYDQVYEDHEEFCRLNPNRNREIVP